MARKTADVRPLLDYANDRLTQSFPEDWTEEEKKGFLRGVIVMIEEALHETGNYSGFHFADEDGNMLDIGEEAPEVGELAYYRRQYYIPRKLRA